MIGDLAGLATCAEVYLWDAYHLIAAGLPTSTPKHCQTILTIMSPNSPNILHGSLS